MNGQGYSFYKLKSFFFLRNCLAIETKDHAKDFERREMKIYTNGPGHMTKMATTPIFGKNPSKIFSRISGPIAVNLVCKILDSSPS